MRYTVEAIALALGAKIAGDGLIEITAAAEPAEAGPGDLAMAMSEKYAQGLAQGSARAAMLWPGADWKALGLRAAIFAPRPRVAMAGVTSLLDRGQGFAPGIHPSALIDPAAELGEDIAVGPFAVIAAGARIGAGSVIGPQCYIGTDTVLGEGAFLREQVSIGAGIRIGARLICQPGVRIGGDGFSFVTPEPSGVEKARETLGDQGDTQAQSWLRIHSLGGVDIGDDVEIGANTTIDSGTIRATRVGSGTKMDSQVQVGHNVQIGRDCLLCAQAGVAGSSVIGDHVVLGGQSGVADNITVGDRVIAAGATKLLSNVPAGRVMMGYPAIRMDAFTEMYKSLRRLTRLSRDVETLKKAVSKDAPTE